MSIFNKAKFRIMENSREKKLQHFYSFFKEGQSVLDVGVSSPNQGWPSQNYFLKNYRYDPKTYTGIGIQDLSGMEDLFPGKCFIQYPGGKLPFRDKEFDWVFSNAVIEHVGIDNEQLFFLNEMMRVASNVFFTTPNKYFPVEAHTNIFFLHWHNKSFYRWLSKNKPLRNKSNLYLFSFSRLKKLLENSRALSFTIYKNHVFAIPITFTVICKD